MRRVIINWDLTSVHGWGVYALNLALNWAADPDIELVSAHPDSPDLLKLDPLSQVALRRTRGASANLVAQLAKAPGGKLETAGTALLALTSELKVREGAYDVSIRGASNIGVCFLEAAALPAGAAERTRELDVVVAGSTWNAELLQAGGVGKVETILQGIDPALFHPAPKRGLLGDRFLVFSGGKLERRKGQDIVVAAFRVFAARHPNAVLVTAWRSLWPKAARSLDVSGLAAPVPFREDGEVDVLAWTRASGIPDAQVVDLGLISNAEAAPLLREMDVAVFPNRCEGGTNLVAMEAMACGVPTILSANTGHLDLIDGDNCFPLTRQAALEGVEAGVAGVAGWGESEVDEVVAALEAAYADREAARARGLKGAETLSRLTWSRTAAEMKATILSFA